MSNERLHCTISVLLAGVFVLSLGGEAYGWHDCPHHHPDRRPATADGAAAEAGSAPLEPAGGPCTCVGSCHAAAASPMPGPAPAAPELPDQVTRPELRESDDTLRPRFPSYFLPYPNGPPSA